MELMLLTLIMMVFTAMGCNMDENDPLTGLNPGCNFAGVCMEMQSGISTCVCCKPDNFGGNICGDIWTCDHEAPTFKCYEFTADNCAVVVKYLRVELEFVTENNNEWQKPHFTCRSGKIRIRGGEDGSSILNEQVQLAAAKKGWPGRTNSMGLCCECSPAEPCGLVNRVVTSGITFNVYVDFSLYYDEFCDSDLWISKKFAECEADYDHGQSAYYNWKRLMGDKSGFINEMNNLLQDTNVALGADANSTSIVAIREFVVLTHEDVILTAAPTISPTALPTSLPSVAPTSLPSYDPTYSPSNNPTKSPTDLPTFYPTPNPTVTPTKSPTDRPTRQPTPNPTGTPTKSPTDSPTREPTDAAAPFYRYYHSGIVNHFYTRNWNELGSGRYGWAYEGVACNIYPTQVPGTIPLYRYNGNSNHFYTTNINEIGTGTHGTVGKHGYKSEGVAGYCFSTDQGSGTVPLYRFYNSGGVDHFYTTSKSEGNAATGWTYEGIQCYVPK